MGNLLSSAVGSNSSTRIFHRMLDFNMNETAFQDLIAADVIPMDELIADNAKYRDSHGKALGILRSTSGITSLISSSIFIWMIMGSDRRLSTTQHRLLLGLCISDIISSSSWLLFNIHAPSDNDYRVWNARGNQDTCTAQGFCAILGVYGGLFYNTSLNLYFLAVVKYNKSEEFIRAKIEPFLHAVPIVVAPSYSVYRLVKKHCNDSGYGACTYPVNDALHCVGYGVGETREGFNIPCWRGIEGAWTAGISGMVMLLIPILIMILSLGMIYSAVRTQEKKLSKYGVGTLRSNLQQQSVTPQDEQSSGFWHRMAMSLSAISTLLQSGTWFCRKTNKPITRFNNSKKSQSRAVMHKAFGYTFAWFLSYGIYLISWIIYLPTGVTSLFLDYPATIFVPLQGLFNLFIFMHPKIMAAKKSKQGEEVSLCRAISTTFWPRGKRGKNHGTSVISNLREGKRNGRPKKIKNENTALDNAKSPAKKKKRADTSQEEEKCEIQVPDYLNPIKTKTMYSAASTATYAPNVEPSSKNMPSVNPADLEIIS